MLQRNNFDFIFRTGHIEYRAPGTEWWVQMAGTVVWGLSFSTLLTLFLTPSALAAPHVLKRRALKVAHWLRRGRGAPVPAGPGVSPEPHPAE